MSDLTFEKMMADMQDMNEKAAISRKEEDKYTVDLPQYSYHSNKYHDLFWKVNVSGEMRPNPNIGWKVHLNIAPEDVVSVSKVLYELDLEHKFLSGGEVQSGKIFTVYLGDKKLMISLVPEIFERIKGVLQPAKANGEIEVMPDIVGRFVGPKTEFATKAAYRGIVLLNHEGGLLTNEVSEKKLEQAWVRANSRLNHLYGDYFGGITDLPIKI